MAYPKLVTKILPHVIGQIACGEHHTIVLSSAPWTEEPAGLIELKNAAQHEYALKEQRINEKRAVAKGTFALRCVALPLPLPLPVPVPVLPCLLDCSLALSYPAEQSGCIAHNHVVPPPPRRAMCYDAMPPCLCISIPAT